MAFWKLPKMKVKFVAETCDLPWSLDSENNRDIFIGHFYVDNGTQ